VGAGPSGLSAAFHLTDPATNPDWSDRYDVTVYQMGWRVGGKGATGRNPDACDRIQEHGIHVFGGMYFNSFRMLKACYDEVTWDTHDKYRTVDEALKPSTVSYHMDYLNGAWFGTMGHFPVASGNPWTGAPHPDVGDIVQSVLSLAGSHLADIDAGRKNNPLSGWAGVRDRIRRAVFDDVCHLSKRVGLHYLDEEKHSRAPGHERHKMALKVLDKVVKLLERRYLAAPDRPRRRSRFVAIDLAVTSLRGLIADDVLTKGIDTIDDINYREWLAKHGASEVTLCSSSPQAIPNTALSYENGDTTRVPTMSAAAFVTFAVREMMGKGAGAYFFAEGTGETVMKPLYRTLVQRGLKFEFFHKLTDVIPDASQPIVDKLVFDVQATTKSGSYEPLRRLADGELVWPDRPNYDQLEQGDMLRIGGIDLESWWARWDPPRRLELERGRDFDFVVLATPIGTLEHTCPALIGHAAAGDAWRRMVESVKTAPTQQVQIWLNEPTRDLGWDLCPGPDDRYVGATYGQDLTSFCDFSDLIAEERWPDDNKPKGLIYFIGALPDPDDIPSFNQYDYPDRKLDQVKWTTVQYLRTIGPLLPASARSAIDSRSLDFDMLAQHDPALKSTGVNRIRQQYFKANIDPNERYTLSVAGTVRARLEAWDSKFDNLVLAGDWIYTGFNVGSFEGAVMGGKLASLALTGAPRLEDVYGYTFLHPTRRGPDRVRMATVPVSPRS
jgi:uncharacterized protein with NAD-binding domain and iron-sulfur cluster